MSEKILFDDVADFLSSENRVFIASNPELSREEIEQQIGLGEHSIRKHRRQLQRHKLGKRHSEYTGVPNQLGEKAVERYESLLEETKDVRPDDSIPFRDFLTSGKTRKYFAKIPGNQTHEEIYKSFYMDANDGRFAYNRLNNAEVVTSDSEELSGKTNVEFTDYGEKLFQFREDIELLISNYSSEEDLIITSD